jgi:serine/threonine-protein kinase
MTLLRAATVISGKYRLDREFARGGMGSIWLARHIQLDMPVAIKFMDAGLPEAADGRARFKREARSAALIRSPHVVQILDHGIDGEVPYIVMELLDGEHLGQRLRREGRISISAAATIATQVAKALRRAHGAGIIHRDLKPANIFLARSDEDEIVKILDFGIAKATAKEEGNESTKTGVLMGSPNYMSPEQARGSKSIDHRSDLWSLGVILFRAITGDMAFTGDSEVDIILNICVGPLPVPSQVAPDLPAEVDAFFVRALAREPAERFQSAREMAAELNDLVTRMGPRADVVGPRRITVDKERATAPGTGDFPISKPALPADVPLWRRLLEGASDPDTARASGKGDARGRQQLPPTLREHSPEEDRPSKASMLRDGPVSSRGAMLPRPMLEDEAPVSSRARAYAGPSPDDNPMAVLRASPPSTSGPASKPQQESQQPFRASLFGSTMAAESSPASIRAIMLARQKPVDSSPASIHANMVAKSREFDAPQRSMHASALARLSSLADPFAPVLASGLAKLSASDDMPPSTRRGSAEDHPSLFPRMMEAKPSSRPPRDLTDSTGQIAHQFDQGILALKTALQNSSRSGESQPPELLAKISALIDEGFLALKTGDRQTTRRCWREALALDPTNRRLDLNLRKLEAKIR